MARAKKITQNINKDAGLLDMPKVYVANSQWSSKWSNYLTCNIGDIVPVYVDEVLPKEKRRVTMGMLSHMTTPIAPIFNAQYTEFRAFFVPHRLSADLLGGYKTRKSPWVKVFGEDNDSTNANIVVPLNEQALPEVSVNLSQSFSEGQTNNTFGGLSDSLDMSMFEDSSIFTEFNFLSLASYELIYQKAYRNQNRESATSSGLYRWLFDLYNRTTDNIPYVDNFHIAQREKDYFTGSQPFTQKGNPVSVGLLGEAPVKAVATAVSGNGASSGAQADILSLPVGNSLSFVDSISNVQTLFVTDSSNNASAKLFADLTSATGVNIEQLRVMIKTQEMLEKDMMYGSDYASSLNAHFGTSPISLVLEEPLELKKVTITSQMQAIFQTSTTANEQTILGTIGANATTQSGSFEIVPLTEFKEHGYLIICAVHKAQNSYDSQMYKPKHLFKKKRFDFYTPELNDLGYQPVTRNEFYFGFTGEGSEAVSFNEAWAEYRFKFNRVHGMFEPSRDNALDYWTLSLSLYDDIESLYKQEVTELDRALSIDSSTAPQFFDAFGFEEYNDKPMSLHSIPGMDGVI